MGSIDKALLSRGKLTRIAKSELLTLQMYKVFLKLASFLPKIVRIRCTHKTKWRSFAVSLHKKTPSENSGGIFDLEALVEWNWPEAHAAGRADCGQEGGESSYYDLHCDLNETLFHSLHPLSMVPELVEGLITAALLGILG